MGAARRSSPRSRSVTRRTETTCTCSPPGYDDRPSINRPTLLEQVRTRVGSLGLVLDHVGECSFEGQPRRVGRDGDHNPVGELAPLLVRERRRGHNSRRGPHDLAIRCQASCSWRTLSRRSDHRADDHADDLPVLGPLVDHDRPVLGVAAARLQLDPVVGRPVEALQRDLGPDPGHHNIALVRYPTDEAVAGERRGDGSTRLPVDARRVPSGSRGPRRIRSRGRARQLASGRRPSADPFPRPGTATRFRQEASRGHAAYVVTTAQQRHLWALPDLAVSGGVVPVEEPRALDLLHDAAVEPDRAAGLFPGRSPEVVSELDAGAPGGSWFDAVRGFLSPGARIEQAVGALDRAGLPGAVHEALSDRLTRVFGSGAKTAEAELDRRPCARHAGTSRCRCRCARFGPCSTCRGRSPGPSGSTGRM